MELSPYYEKKIECFNCKKSFSSLKVRSKTIKVEHTESDFQPIYAENTVNGYFYNVFVCEHCGFAFTEDFTKYFAPGVQQEIQDKITKNWVNHSLGGERSLSEAIQAYKLALLSGVTKKEKFVTTAGLALRLAWLNRSVNNEVQERRFLKIARDYYMNSYSNEDYSSTQMSEMRILYMIGELSRRIEDFGNATRYFSKVIEKQNVGGEAKLIEMAKEQWNKLREQREINQ